MSLNIDASTIGATRTDAAAGKTPVKELDKDTFLQLLITQLSNQDPSSPMDTSQMMAQTTQLGMMEALTEIQASSREQFALQMRMASADLVGQQVGWTEDGATKYGVVDSVDYSGSVPLLKIGKTEIPLDAVSSVLPAGATPPVTADPDGDTDSTTTA
ncbi:flagellar hook capping FlgD N-terminal domain-containing protein [Cellulomonas triticagri]|uniref:Flagellar hook capping protein n=1 Tax=Cellulomonas triticagri TaxID=2483352 RepID=A0A3M2IWF1_9CELL|nr:flagellar hook capping FlgD N-terminal domain-containing protein [Cellulomonas triticagri]RMI03643.1 flagellar hook capping protein [Cellulomonas triticagri]